MFMSLSTQQREVVQAVEDGRNVFVTGGAGTGKSYLLKYLKTEYMSKPLHITASTGIAAVQIGGVTLHSWAGLGLGNTPVHEILKRMFSPRGARMRNKLKRAKMLAIDEISMISADTLDLLNEVLKGVRENEKPFGGLQLILFGDFLQLPPIFRNATQNQFCFMSKSWQEANIKNFVLTKVFRQQEEDFVNLLNNMRFGNVTRSDIEILKQRYNAVDIHGIVKPTIITTHNYQVQKINEEKLKEIPSKEHYFFACTSGNPQKCEFLKKNCIAPEKLTLKIGSQVMMLKNTYQKEGVINGSLGIVTRFSPKRNYPIVEFNNGKLLTIRPEVWAIEKYNEKTGEMEQEATLSQIPLNLSWAVTVHKSQGMTLDKIQCDLMNAFAEGQVYVALSRVRNLSGLFLKSFNINKVLANPKIIEFYRNIENHKL